MSANSTRRPPNDDPEGKKWCPKCQDYQPVDEFHKNKSKPRGLASYCKKHQLNYVNESRSVFPLENKDVHND